MMRHLFLGSALLAFAVTCLRPTRADIHATDFGKTADGTSVQIYQATNSKGMVIRVMSRGATLVGVELPVEGSEPVDVVFGFDDIAGYESDANGYFGATVGRYANRIAGGQLHARRPGISPPHQRWL